MPFCVGGLESSDPYDVRTFLNRWPTFADERAEVVLYASEHEARFWSIGVAGAPGRRPVGRAHRCPRRPADVDYVLVFENRGAEVGATIPHPHGQIYGYESVPPGTPLAELRRAEAARCPCPRRTGLRLVSEVGGWRAGCPWASK